MIAKMRFNNFILIKYICIISISIIMYGCSIFRLMDHNNADDIVLNDVDSVRIHNNKIKKNLDDAMQLKIEKLKIVNTIYFALDRYNIISDFFSILDMHADFLCHHPFCKIRIEGHTDERGTPEYNIALGERRAYSVKTYLQSKGVLSNQMEIVSYGKEKPICFGHTEEVYSKNRRVILSY